MNVSKWYPVDTNPEYDGLYAVEVDTGQITEEFYFGETGWQTDDNVIAWHYLPMEQSNAPHNTPTPPEAPHA